MSDPNFSSLYSVWRRFSRLLATALAVLTLGLTPFLAACSGSNAGDSGEVVIGLTDADGDFLTYQVDVQSLTLTHEDGTVVEVLPLTTRVDFAEYTEMTEFLTAAMVPNGVYTKGELTVDYGTADVQVEVNGEAVPTTLLDADGNALNGPLTMAVHLDDINQLTIRPGVPAHIVFDFELAATNQVDLADPALPVVTVDPVLLAEVDRDFDKPHRLRGLLKEVVVEESLFRLHTRPFAHRHLGDHFGDFTVMVEADTEFEIDGIAYVGPDGLAALAVKPVRTPVVALGHINRAERHMVAKRVRAGDSVPWGEKDVVKGIVVQRSADTLTVQGASISFAEGRGCRNHFRSFVMVQLDPTATRVTAPGLGEVDTDAISIGQRITAVGNLTTPPVCALPGDEAVITVVPTLSADKVNMHYAQVAGEIVALTDPVAPDAGELVLALMAMNGHRLADYDFTGTGIDAANDADPANYQIDTGALDLSTLNVGDKLRVRGLVTPFGTAPADFTASSLFLPPIEVDTKGMLQVGWMPPTGHPFDAVDATGLTLDLSSPDLGRHHLIQRGGVTDLTTLTGPVLMAPEASGLGRYAIHGRDNHLFRDYTGFSEALTRLLADAKTVHHVTAHGIWDPATDTLTIGTLVVLMGRDMNGPIDILPMPGAPETAAPETGMPPM